MMWTVAFLYWSLLLASLASFVAERVFPLQDFTVILLHLLLDNALEVGDSSVRLMSIGLHQEALSQYLASVFFAAVF